MNRSPPNLTDSKVPGVDINDAARQSSYHDKFKEKMERKLLEGIRGATNKGLVLGAEQSTGHLRWTSEQQTCGYPHGQTPVKGQHICRSYHR